jgi:uncharacterized membrane protein
MSFLALGLLIFLGVHSVRIFAEGWRQAQIARLGEAGWKGGYSLASAIGLGLIIWGYGLARGGAGGACGRRRSGLGIWRRC